MTKTAEQERAATVAWLCNLDDEAEARWRSLNWFQKIFVTKYDAIHCRLAHAIIQKYHHKGKG